MRTSLLPVVLVALMMAGCSDRAGGAATADDDPLSPRLEATPTTGVLRGVVVDEAIRPLANVSVSINGPSGARNMTTSDDGFFGFQGLEPGTYFVSAAKIAHAPAQASAEVIAGVDDPPVVKVQLVFLPSEAPFVSAFKFEGFAECIVPGANVCFIANFYPCLVQQAAGQPCTGNITNDDSFFFLYDVLVAQQRIPDWTQIEMVWESTQSATDWLSFRMSAHSPDDGASISSNNKNVRGKSPTLAIINATQGEDWELGLSEGLAFETFSGGNDLTCGGLPVQACLGVVYNQRIDYYFHLFYGYTPPEGWRFTEAQSTPPPPQ